MVKMNHQIAFVLVVESGSLESKSILLVDSIRNFAGEFCDSPIWVVQPRKGHPISPETMSFYIANNVTYINSNLNRKWKHYGVANKVYAAAFSESILVDQVDTLVLLDSDTIFLKPPQDLLLKDDKVIGLRPVDKINIGLSLETPINDYWKVFYEHYGVSPDKLWSVNTTADQKEIRAYFNSGVVAVKPSLGLFQAWRDCFEQLCLNSKMSNLDQESKEFFHLDQASLSAMILGQLSRDQVKIFDHRYNYPLHLHCKGELPNSSKVTQLDESVLVHYHNLFYDLNWFEKILVGPEIKQWLLKRLPLKNFYGKSKFSFSKTLKRHLMPR